MDGGLEGTWCSADGSDLWTLAMSEPGHYGLLHGSEPRYAYSAHHFEVAGHEFLDIDVMMPNGVQSAHALARLTTAGDSIQVGFLDPDWVRERTSGLQMRPLTEELGLPAGAEFVGVANDLLGLDEGDSHVITGSVMLRASPAELRGFLSSVADSRQAFHVVVTVAPCP